MRRHLIAWAGLGLLLGACGTTASGPVVTNVAATPGPLAVEGQDWHFVDLQDDTARLVYGPPESDDVKLQLDCGRRSGQLELATIVQNEAKPQIYLESGGDTERFAAKSEPAETHEGLFLTATASTKEPVFQRFRSVGWIAVWLDQQRVPLVPHPGSRDGIERFFVFCG